MKKILLALIVFSSATAVAQTVGLIKKDSASIDGYVLMSPINTTITYLIDKCGFEVHRWTSGYGCGLYPYLLEDGSLVRPGQLDTNAVFKAPGHGGIIEKYDWDGTLLWSYRLSSDTDMQHHDIVPLPNGNILALLWDLRTPVQATAMGRDPATLVDDSLWCEKIFELKPVGTDSAVIVWQWNMCDHVIQDIDQTKQNYGAVAQHPELLDLNYLGTGGGALAAQIKPSDWLHCNALAYNAKLDQIILNSRNLSEFWVIDHGTTTAEAAGHTGGRYGKGGDILYRWGNPEAYRAGDSTTATLWGPHNPHWIDSGLVNAGKILIFNNGVGRPGGDYSSVEIISPPVDSAGNYSITPGQHFAPDSSEWKYKETPRISLNSPRISGADMMPNGHMLICEGDSGVIFEIDEQKNVVWMYINPVEQHGIVSQGQIPNLSNLVFRANYISPYAAALAGRTLVAGAPIELNPTPYTCTMHFTAIDDDAAAVALTVVNPFSDAIMIRSDVDVSNATLALLDITGREIATTRVSLSGGSLFQWNIESTLPQGLYFLRLGRGQQFTTIKLINE